MSLLTITLLFLFGAIAALSVHRIIRLPRSFKVRATLITLRVALLAALAIAFIEPAIVLERLPKSRSDIPVLIDGSKSMRLFASDSTLRSSLSAFERWNAFQENGKRFFRFYLFGDSLRKTDPKSVFTWSDQKSFFPETTTDPHIRDAPAIILCTDGNWSNTTNPGRHIAEKNVYYLPFSSFHESPWLHLDGEALPSALLTDSTIVVHGTIQGVLSNAGTITVTVSEKNRILGSVTVAARRGYFRQAVQWPLSFHVPGRHMLRFDASANHDSLSFTTYRLHQVLPRYYTWSMAQSPPTLDRRFLRMAIERRAELKENASPRAATSDLLVIFRWDSTSRKMLPMVKPRGVLLFIGCLPFPNTPLRITGPLDYYRPPAALPRNPFDGLDLNAMPPPALMLFCKRSLSRPSEIFLFAHPKNKGTGMPDTLDVLFTGRFNGIPYIACSAAELWQWNFLPLAIAPDEERNFTFFNGLLTLAVETLGNALSGDLLLYPVSPLSAADSLRLRIAFPSDISLPSTVRFSCDFSERGKNVYDTSFTMTATGSRHQDLAFKPLKQGVYHLNATASSEHSHYRFSDSLTINEDRSEYMIKGQNTPLLDELAVPLLSTSDSVLRDRFFTPEAATLHSVKETFPINRGWALLILIFLFMGSEWLLRRLLRLE
jgi:hypothetical protein